MSIISKIGAAVGVGAADVSVAVEQPEVTWNDMVRGTVRVQGGSVEQTATELRISVEEHFETPDSEGGTDHHYIHHSEAVLATQVTVHPGAAQEWPFQIQVPHLVTPGHDWHVVARFCVPRAADQQSRARLNMKLPVPLRTVAQAVVEAGGLTLSVCGVRSKEQDVLLEFRPSKELKQHLDGVTAWLRPEGDGVAGTLEINPQEKSLTDVLKSLAKKDRVRQEIRFTGAEVATPGLVAERLRGILAPYLQ